MEIVECPSAADAGLDLIENQQSACLVAPFTQRLEKTGCRQLNTAFSLNRFDQNAGRTGGDLCQIFQRIEPYLARVGQQRTFLVALLLSALLALVAVCTGVFGVLYRDHLGASGVAFGQF